MDSNIKSGNIVSTSKHSHKMTFNELNSEGNAICMYFIDTELHIEIHELKDLTFISD